MAAFCFKVSAEICKRILGKKSYNSNKKIFKKIRNIWSKVYKKIHNIFNHFKMQYYKMQKDELLLINTLIVFLLYLYR